MKNALTAFFVLALTACSANPRSTLSHMDGGAAATVTTIIGGEEVQDSDEIAKTVVAVLDRKSGTLCSASLLSDDLVVTAAHCVHDSLPQNLLIIFGENLRDQKNVEAHKVVRFIENPDYTLKADQDHDFGDLALVKFFGGFPKDKGYKAANLLFNQSKLIDGTPITLAGYGSVSGSSALGAGILRKVDVTLQNVHWSTHEVLVDQSNGKGACHGDSGGPAYINMNGELYLFGVTSRGINDPQNTCLTYGAYTDIMAYDAWLTYAMQVLENSDDTSVDPGTDPVDDWSPKLKQIQPR